MKLKNHFVIGFYVVLVIVGAFTVIQFLTPLNPAGFVANNVQNLSGITVDYNIPSIINPFYYSSLDVATSAALHCTLYADVFGNTDQGQKITLSQGVADAPAFFYANNLLGIQTVQNLKASYNFVSFIVSEKINCPVSPYAQYPPILKSGTLTLHWTATNKAGNVQTVTTDTKSISTIPLPQNIGNGQNVILYEWTIPKSSIENAVQVNPLGDNFVITNKIEVDPSLTLNQGSSTLPWLINVSPVIISLQLQEVTNPVITSGSVGGNIAMQVTAVPDLQHFNPQGGNPLVKIQITESNYQTTQTPPEIKLFSTDLLGNVQGNPMWDVFLSKPDSVSSTGLATWNIAYQFASTTPSGDYVFKLIQNGNTASPSANIHAGSSPITCNPPVTYLDGSTNTCKTTQTINCPDGSVISANNKCPVPPPTNPCTTQQQSQGYTNVNGVCTPPAPIPPVGGVTCTPPLTNQNGICLPPVDINGWIAIIQQNIFWIFAGLIAFGIVYHVLNTKRGGKGLVIEEE